MIVKFFTSTFFAPLALGLMCFPSIGKRVVVCSVNFHGWMFRVPMLDVRCSFPIPTFLLDWPPLAVNFHGWMFNVPMLDVRCSFPIPTFLLDWPPLAVNFHGWMFNVPMLDVRCSFLISAFLLDWPPLAVIPTVGCSTFRCSMFDVRWRFPPSSLIGRHSPSIPTVGCSEFRCWMFDVPTRQVLSCSDRPAAFPRVPNAKKKLGPNNAK